MLQTETANLALLHAPPQPERARPPRVAVLVPCFNEALTIRAVIEDFRAQIPQVSVHVCDNNSDDGTLAVAEAAGALTQRETRQGKGHVVRRLFADIEADCYILVDGDGTYDASVVRKIVDMVAHEGLDFVNVARASTLPDAYRPGHRLGNHVLTGLVRLLFGRQTSDMLSGYKGFSRRFVKSFPAMSGGFEIETELTVHALEMRMPMGEIVAPYSERPAGSTSKLRTYRDGMRILMLISRLIKDERPLHFFLGLGAALAGLGVALGLPVVLTFLETGLVPRMPTALLSTGLVVLGCLSGFSGIILDVVTKARQETKRMAYLAHPLPRFR